MMSRKQRSRRVGAVLLGASMLIGGCSLTENPYESKTVKGQEAIVLIDSMRAKGSFEDARLRLTDTAAAIADRVAAAVPGQTWRFNDDPHGQNADRQGLSCEKLTGDIARRPIADGIDFGRLFTAEEFSVAVGIVRAEAAKDVATEESSLFNDRDRRDYDVRGNGYEFTLRQSKVPIVDITGECFLMQSVVDLPPGQMPPEPPILLPDPTPTP